MATNPLALPADWSFRVGERFLAGAQMCGCSCQRTAVIDVGSPPRMCYEPCQLTVSVTEGLIHPDDEACGVQTVGSGLLAVDLCKVVTDLDGTWDSAQMRKSAQAASKVRGQILQGLQKMLSGCFEGEDFQAWLVDPIQLSCRNVDIGSWSIVDEENTGIRWGLPFTVKL